MKASVKCTVNITQNVIFHIGMVGKLLEKSEKSGYQHFTFFPPIFSRLLVYSCLTHSLINHFETVPNLNKMQATTEMWLLKDFKIQIA